MPDIETRADIDKLMQRFYRTAIDDEQIGFIFTDVAKLDLEKHLPIIGDFWESVVLGRNVYLQHGRNPLEIHFRLNELIPLTSRHFARWLELFRTAVDDDFSGERADFTKARAEAIANRILGVIGAGDAGPTKQEKPPIR